MENELRAIIDDIIYSTLDLMELGDEEKLVGRIMILQSSIANSEEKNVNSMLELAILVKAISLEEMDKR